jgi:hypothetical protein
MPHGVVREIIPAPAAEVFRLIHDYGRRLEWDTLLQRAFMVDGRKPAVGAVAVCKGRPHLGGIELRTEYVSFDPPRVAAVRMVNRPPFFDTWAATIRHEPLSDSSSAVEYKYHFRARPRWLRSLLHPLMNTAFKWETRRRLRALKGFFGRPAVVQRLAE